MPNLLSGLFLASLRKPAWVLLASAAVAGLFLLPFPQSGVVAAPSKKAGKILVLEVLDAETREPVPARFSLAVDGVTFEPADVGRNGLRFVSVHESKRQVFVATYTRGTGPVEVALPDAARMVEVHAVRGLEYLPATVSVQAGADAPRAIVLIRRWTNLAAKGWVAADGHVHYDRFTKGGDRDWFTMLQGDDLASAHFMMLKGGKVPGIWAEQYGYGKAGEGSDGERLLTAGMEYRDGAQGHVNLLGMPEIIQPIMAGGGTPNYPALNTVLLRTRESGGLAGVAHGGSLSREPTVILDAVLGTVDFMEIGNSHLYSIENWYRLMNCGFHLPPAAGTDLPNYPDRDPWQPFLGGMRMYARVGQARDFESWKEAVRKGKVFVTSGPLLSFTVNKKEPGETVELPGEGGEVLVEAELASPLGLRKMELILNGKPVEAAVRQSVENGVHRWNISQRVQVNSSSWLAVRGEGIPIQALHRAMIPPAPYHKRDAIAHSAAIRVMVGGQPIWSVTDAAELVERLRRQREFYLKRGRYGQELHRQEMTRLFDRAIAALEEQSN